MLFIKILRKIKNTYSEHSLRLSCKCMWGVPKPPSGASAGSACLLWKPDCFFKGKLHPFLLGEVAQIWAVFGDKISWIYQFLFYYRLFWGVLGPCVHGSSGIFREVTGQCWIVYLLILWQKRKKQNKHSHSCWIPSLLPWLWMSILWQNLEG